MILVKCLSVFLFLVTGGVDFVERQEKVRSVLRKD